jgi:hypothetical protein
MALPEPSSASFKRHYTEAQKNAILDAHCRLDMSQRAITRHCHAGTLPDPGRPGETVPSFDISRGTVAIYIHRGADDYRALLLEDGKVATGAVDTGTAELVLHAEQRIRDLKRRRRAGEEIDYRELQQLATLLATLRRAIRHVKPPNPPAGRKQIPQAGSAPLQGKPETPEILQRMGLVASSAKRGSNGTE